MRRPGVRGAALLWGALILGCSSAEEGEGFSEAEWGQIHGLQLPDALAPVAGTAGDGGDELALLGQQLFFDRGLVGPGDGGCAAPDGGWSAACAGSAAVACNDCHDPSAWFSDARAARATSLGVRWTGRNSPGLLNVAWNQSWGLDGRGESLANQAIIAYVAAATMAGDEQTLGRALLARYRDRYEKLFGALPEAALAPGADAGLTQSPDGGPSDALKGVMRNAALAWAAYLRRLQTRPAPFDRWASGERGLLSPAQQRGLKLFLGQAGCVECHNGPIFSDGHYHALGLAQVGPNVPSVDRGRFDGIGFLASFVYRLDPPPEPDQTMVGAFRTRSLRNVSRTGPYFHAGQYESLREVIWFYDRGGDRAGAGTPSGFLVPLGLSEDQASDLEAFLGSLTGALPEAGLLCDNSRLPGRPQQQCAGGPR